MASKPPYKNLSLKDMPGERWEDIPGYSDYYQVSQHGRIKSPGRWVERKSIKGDYYTKGKIKKQQLGKSLIPEYKYP